MYSALKKNLHLIVKQPLVMHLCICVTSEGNVIERFSATWFQSKYFKEQRPHSWLVILHRHSITQGEIHSQRGRVANLSTNSSLNRQKCIEATGWMFVNFSSVAPTPSLKPFSVISTSSAHHGTVCSQLSHFLYLKKTHITKTISYCYCNTSLHKVHDREHKYLGTKCQQNLKKIEVMRQEVKK